jgi:NAD(P)-dependent dehydrogenase (short-subunit alcohol dehydrogenase family)
MVAQLIDLSGKRALITGANSGIGAGIATCLASCGARVIINYVVNPEVANALADEINRTYGEGTATPLMADISDEAAVENLFERSVQTLGGIDILVNNAGIESMFAALDLSSAEWDRIMNVNLRGAFICARTAARRMVTQGQGGVIINNASMHDTIARLGATHYCVSKAGLAMLTKMLALEWAEYGIRVVGVSPGAIDTRAHWNEDTDDWLPEFLSWIPLGRLGKVEDVARTVAFVASDAAAYITGTTIYVDGAYSINLVRYDERKWQEGE